MKKSTYLIGLALGASTLTFAQVGIGTSYPSSPLDIQADDAAIDINNTNAGDGDPVLNFQIGSVTKFSLGVDESDSEKFKIGTTAPATSTSVTIDASQNVGIGNTSPTAKLDVDGSAIFNESGAAVDFRVEGDTEANLLFVDGSADMVGIGTSSPGTDLHVKAFKNGFKVGNTAESGMLYTTYEGSSSYLNLEENDDPFYFRGINAAAADTAYITFNNGNVGIGDFMVTPTSMLQILNTDATANAVEDMLTITKSTTGASAAGIGAGLIFQVEDGGDTEEQGRINVELDDVTNGSEDATMTFDINQNGTMTEVMRIDGTSGNVGIGTTSPSTKLHVNGVLRVERNSASVAQFDRTGNDGWIVVLQQDGTTEGTISVAGTTVSYNAFTGSHYAYSKEETFERGMLVSFNGNNEHFHNNPKSEILYGINYTSKANDGKVAGVFLNLSESTKELSLDNPYQIMAVGNGDVWVTDEGGDIATGDYLISSSTVGHAMKDNGDFEVSHIFAKATESVDWSTVEPDSNGVKRKKIIVYFEAFDKPNYEKKFKEQQAIIEAQKKENESQKAEIESLKAEATNTTSASEENAQKLDANTSEIEALKAQVQQLLQLLQQQESASVVK